MAGALLFDEKNPQKCYSILVWIVGCWNSLLTRVIQRTIDVSPAFLEHGSVEKITV
jgi:hypothetical protein